MNYEKKRIIDLYDMLHVVLGQGICILIVAVIVAVAFGAIKYKKDTEIQSPVVNESLDGTQPQISEEKMAAVNTAKVFQNSIKNQHEYIENSVYVNTDMFEQYCVALQYELKGPSEKIELYMSSIANYVESGAIGSDIYADGYDLEPQYINELIVIGGENSDTSEDQNNYSLNINNQNLNEMSVGICIEVIERNGEQSETLANETSKAIENYVNKCFQEGFEFALRDKKACIKVDADGYKYVKDNLTNLQNLKDSYDKLTGGFDDEQLNLLNGSEEQENVEVKPVENVRINVKFVFLGAILGAVLAILCICILYLFGGAINLDEYTELFGVRIFGIASKRKVQNRDIEFAAASLSSYLKKNEIDKLLISYDSCIEKDRVELVTKCLDDNKIPYKVSEFNASSYADMKEIADCENAVVLQKLRKSKFEVFASLLSLYKTQGIEVEGIIIC